MTTLATLVEVGKQPVLSAEETDALANHSRATVSNLLRYKILVFIIIIHVVIGKILLLGTMDRFLSQRFMTRPLTVQNS